MAAYLERLQISRAVLRVNNSLARLLRTAYFFLASRLTIVSLDLYNYTPPHSPETIWDDLVQRLSQIRLKFPKAMFLLGGDFNCPGIN